VEEKNPTVVNFPLKGVDFRDCQFMRLCHLVLKKYSLPPTDLSSAEQHPPPVYDLIANVIHESVAGTTRDKENTVWKVQLRAGSGENEKWFQIQDLIVEEIRKEMIFLGETVIQVPLSLHDHPAIADHCLLDMGTPNPTVES
jgi:U4/U6.U5 tri-snRNP-associated protein 2